MRKGLFVATGGLSGATGIKANSKKERTTKAAEKQLRLQKQQMKLERPAATAQSAARALPWLVAFEYDGGHMLGHSFGRAQGFVSEEQARKWATKKTTVKTPSRRKLVVGFTLLHVDPSGPWQVSYDLKGGATVLGDRFTSKEDAVLVGKATWKVGTDFRVVERWHASPVSPAPARRSIAAAQPVQTEPDAIEQLRRLGELRDTGVLSEAEFDAKKAELLGRI